MRAAYVCADPGVPVFGCKGASVHMREVVRAMVRRGAQVELFATCIGEDAPPALPNVRIHALPPIARGKLGARERSALAANDGLRASLERSGPFDLVYERYSLWSFAGMEYARAITAPGLLEVNAPLIEEQARHRGLMDRTAAERVAERAFRSTTALLAVSDGVAQVLQAHPSARGRVHVVPNGVDPNRFPSDPVPARSGAGGFVVGFVGSLKPWHDLETLVEAFAELHRQDASARLLIVGHGPERDRLTANLAAHGLAAAVHLIGAVDPAAIPGLLRSMDVAVAPYRNIERFYFSPLKVYEYMAAGVPVVASRIGQLADLIEDGVTGLLCPPGDAVALSTALERLRTDPDLRVRLGRAGRMAVMRHHTWDAVVSRILVLAGLEPRADLVLREAS